MPRMINRTSVVSIAVAGAVLGGPLAGAQANDSTVRTTIESYNAKIAKDEMKIVNAAAAYDRTHSSAPLIAALKHEVHDLRALQAKLSKESASTSRGRQGKQDITKGVGLIATGYGALARDVKAAGAKQPISKKQLAATKRDDRKGHALVQAGIKLLG